MRERTGPESNPFKGAQDSAAETRPRPVAPAVTTDNWQDTHSLFRQLLDAAPDAMVVADDQGTIVLVNAVTEHLFGYARSDLEGRPTEVLLPRHHHRAHRRLRRRFLSDPHLRPVSEGYEMDGRRCDGSIFPAEVQLGLLDTADGLWIVSDIRDISRRKQAEKEIQENLSTQKVVAAFLRLSLESTSLDDLLQQGLEILLDLPWLRIENCGAIYLWDNDSQELVMRAHKDLPPDLLDTCARVPLGRGLCGQAAQNQESVFTRNIDHRHEIHHDGKAPRGHYCIPIVKDRKLFGVLKLYLQDGHEAAPGEGRFLSLVADTLAGAIASHQAEAELLAQKTQLLAAQRIQEHILATETPDVPGFQIAGAYNPAEFAAGDHYDHFLLSDGSLAFGIGDVSGHGFSSALLMASTHAYIHALAAMDLPVDQIFNLANRNLNHETDASQFITAIFGKVDPDRRELSYASAGHPSGYVFDGEGRLKAELSSTGIPLAVLPDVVYEMGDSVQLVDGDIVLLMTDGVLETEDPGGDFFGEDRVLGIIADHHNRPATDIVKALIGAVDVFRGSNPQDDDVTALVIKAVRADG